MAMILIVIKSSSTYIHFSTMTPLSSRRCVDP